MTRWMRGPEFDRPRNRAPFDPVAEGARYHLSRELSRALWERVCTDATDAAGRCDLAQAQQRFHDLAARIAARGGRLHPDVGKLTRIGTESDGTLYQAAYDHELAVPGPGRQTLVAAEPRRWQLPRDAVGTPGRTSLVAAEAHRWSAIQTRPETDAESTAPVPDSHEPPGAAEVARAMGALRFPQRQLDVESPRAPESPLGDRISGLFGFHVATAPSHSRSPKLHLGEAVAPPAAVPPRPSPRASRFDDFLALGFREVLQAAIAHGRQRPHPPTPTANRAGTRAALPVLSAPWLHGGPGGRVLWHAAERHAATLYRRAVDSGEVEHDGPAVEAALQRCGSGLPLPDEVRRTMEARLGVPLDRVRIHTDRVAAEAARAVNAEAFTVGEDIFFAEGAYAPESRTGQKLLAHELTHVVQSWQGRTEGGVHRVSQPGDALEQEADAVAERVDRGETAQPTTAQREKSPHADAERADARQAEEKPDRAPSGAPRPAVATKPATGSPALLRKAAVDPRRGTPDTEPETAEPEIQPVTRPGPDAATPPVPRPTVSFAKQLDTVASATRATLARLDARIEAARQAPVGAAAEQRAKDHKKQADEHQHAAAAATREHLAAAAAHKRAGHDGGPAEAPAVDTLDPHSPIQFKKISDWAKYMPQPMLDQDERERARILKLVQRKVEGERAESQRALTKLHDAHLKQAAAVRAMKPKLQGQIAHAERAALAKIAAAEASQAAAVHSAFAAAQGRVSAAAGTARSQVHAAYAEAVATINAANQAAAHKLTQDQGKANADLMTAVSMQVIAIQAAFTTARTRMAAADHDNASHAAGLADTVQLPYSGKKLSAAKKAAHQTAEGWAKDIPSKMEAQAKVYIYSHQDKTEEQARGYAEHQGHRVKTTYDKLTKALHAAHTQALKGAAAARSQALSQIDSIAASTCASLAAQSAAQVAAVHGQASTARSGILKAGRAAQASTARVCGQAASGLDQGAQGLVKGAKLVETPGPDQTEKAVRHGAEQLKTTSASIASELKHTATQSAQGLAAQAVEAAKGMAATAAAARTSAAQIAQGASQSIGQAAQGASQSLTQMGQGFARQATAVADGGQTAFHGIVKETKDNYHASAKLLRHGLKTSVDDLKGNFKTGIDKDEPPAILKNAKKAADAVKPWWQKALAFVLVIVVVVVITLVLTAATGGLADMVLAPFLAGAIEVGGEAVAGGVANVVGEIVNNVVMGDSPLHGVHLGKDLLFGAVANLATLGLGAGIGKIGGKIGGDAFRAAMEGGAKGLGSRAIKTGINFTAGMGGDFVAQVAVNHNYKFSMENLVTTLALSGVMSTSKFENFQKGLGDKIKGLRGKTPEIETPPLDIGDVAPPSEPGSGGTGTHDSATPGKIGEPTGQVGTPEHGPAPRPEGGSIPGHGSDPGHAPTSGHGEGGTTSAPTGRGPGKTSTPGDDHGKPSGDRGNKPDDDHGQTSGDDHGNKPSGDHGNQPGDDHGQASGDDHGNKPGDDHGNQPGDDPGNRPGDDHGNKPGDDPGNKPGDDHGNKPGDDPGNKPGDDLGSKPANKPGDGASVKPAEPGKTTGDPEARSPEQQAHDEARDAEMNADGYPEGTRATADKTASEIESGKLPPKDGLRDTEANVRGREQLEKLLQDPKISPAERARIEKALAGKLRGESDPTGNLGRDLADARTQAKNEATPGDPAAEHPGPASPDGAKQPAGPGAKDGAISLTGKGDALAEAARWVHPEPGKLDVVVHGDADSFYLLKDGSYVKLDHRSLATYIKKAGGAGEDIRLISCEAGESPRAIAQHLANKLGVEVTAPSDTVWVHPDGRLTIGKDAASNTGNWNTFKPGTRPDANATPGTSGGTPGDADAAPTTGNRDSTPAHTAPEQAIAAGKPPSPKQEAKFNRYLKDFVPDAAEQKGVRDLVQEVQNHPQIEGLGDWIEFSMQAQPGADPASVRANLRDDASELRVALEIANGDPSAHVQIGNDQRAPVHPVSHDRLPSFDLKVSRGGGRSNVEVKTVDGDTLRMEDLGAAINHASDKIIDDPAVPKSDHTKGAVEAALVTTWPQPLRTLSGKRTITVKDNGDTVMTMPNGYEVPQGNLFERYLDILNGTSGAKGAAPAGASRVDALTIYDRSGKVIQRFVKDPSGVWTRRLGP